MATQLMQLPCQQEEQLSPQATRSHSHARFLGQYPQGVAPRSSSWAAAASSSPDTALYEHSIVNEGSQVSHGRGRRSPVPAADGDASWEVRAFAEDSSSCSGQWPPRSYACSFCRREFRTAQALGGHMNVHRRERAQANSMAILRSTAAAAGTAPSPGQQQQHGANTAGATQWCLYSPMGVGSPGAIDAPVERRAFLYSNLAPGGAIIAMPSSSGGSSSQFTSLSSGASAAPSHNHTSKKGAAAGNEPDAAAGVLSSAPSSSPPQFSAGSPVSSPLSQGSRSSGSSVVTSQGGAGGAPSYRSTSTGSGDSASFTKKQQQGAFQPYYQTSSSSPSFALEPTPLVTHELIQLRPQGQQQRLLHHSTLFSKSMVFRGPSADDFLDLELRLGPAC